MIQIVAYFLENPGASESGTAYHNRIDAIVVESRLGLFRRGDVTIADDRDMDAWVAFHLTNQRPVGFTSIHLGSGASVDGQCLYATIL